MARKPAQIKPSATAHCITDAVRETATPRLMTLRAASQYLGLSLWAVRERIWQGQLPVVQFDGGRKMYLDVRDLDAFVEKHKQVKR